MRPDPDEVMHRLACQLLGKGEGFSQGVERSFHYGYLAPEHGILHVGMISHLGAMIPVAAGCAFAFRQSGSDRVAMNFIGDGATSTGDFHEGLNMAAVWKLPLVLVIENNRYAFSTPARLQYAAERLSDRGLGYGIAAETVDGNDPDAMAEALGRAVARARAGQGPTLLEAMLGRMRGHSEGDDSLKVVPPDELAAYRAADPVPAYARRLEEEGVLDARRSASGWRRGSPRWSRRPSPTPSTRRRRPRTVAWRPVFAPDPPRRVSESTAIQTSRSKGETTYVDAINQAMLEEMERDSSVVVMGQDIGVFEGAFRTTKGLHSRWPHRVLDTPIAESGTIGIAIGAALLGYRPVVEMQFGDFISCGFNQLVNVAAKLYYRWQVPCPIVVRLPTGGGVGAGPFHSQNPEGWFAQTAGIKVICPATASDAMGLLKAAIRDPNPVMLFEHKFLYRRIKKRPAGRRRRGQNRRGQGDAAGQAPDADRLRRHHLDLPGSGGRAGEVGRRGRGDRPAHARPLRRGDGARLGQADGPGAHRPRSPVHPGLRSRSGRPPGRRGVPLAGRADSPRDLPGPAGAVRQEPGEGVDAGQGEGGGGGPGADGVLSPHPPAPSPAPSLPPSPGEGAGG